MRTLFLAKKNYILSMLHVGHFAHSIASITGVHTFTTSRLHSKECSELYKSFGGCPTKLTPTNIHHAIHLTVGQKTVPMFGCFAKIDLEQIQKK